MKFLGCFLAVIALVVVTGGGLALTTGFPNGGSTSSAVDPPDTDAIMDPTASENAESTSVATQPSGEVIPTPDIASTLQPATAGARATAAITDVSVGKPSMEIPTFPLASVEATYTEFHEFGQITVRFRPGAYSAEHAAEVAQQTVEALAEANAKLQTNWNEDLTVFLADQLFAEDCLGCQGFTESDFRWIFMLDDGSVVPDEFEALLVHEATHLIAGNMIHLPFDIFYVEGLATWVMTDDLLASGYVSPLQSTAWVYGAGALPGLETIMEDDFAGRMRKRVYYDAAAAFAFFVIETYGWDSYISLYQQRPMEAVLGKPVTDIEAEWHGYLEPLAVQEIGGVDAAAWWHAASQVIDAYGRFYSDPTMLSAEQYRLLTLSRLALNRADVDNAISYLSQSGV